jgi:hypothetical protein
MNNLQLMLPNQTKASSVLFQFLMNVKHKMGKSTSKQMIQFEITTVMLCQSGIFNPEIITVGLATSKYGFSIKVFFFAFLHLGKSNNDTHFL